MSDTMNGIPRLRVRDQEMLPTVVRRDGGRSPALAGNRSLRARSDEQLAVPTDAVMKEGYSRLRHAPPPVVKAGSCAKGLIIDVWV